MIEGQNGLTWDRWIHILALAERLQFPSLFRSDHYFVRDKQQDSLEAYLSFVLAARETKTLRFGPLVTPITFRNPVNVARMAAQLDVLSGGRFVMGLGAGWNESEHRTYGLNFPPAKERYDRLEESIQLSKALWRDENATFQGKYYHIDSATSLPRPLESSIPILIGGVGEYRTLGIAARHADEWNAVTVTVEEYGRKRAIFDGHCEMFGRDPASIRRSMMVFGIVGHSLKDLDNLTKQVMPIFGADVEGSPEEFRKSMKSRGIFSGLTSEVVDQLGTLATLGLDEMIFQHVVYDSDEIPEYLAAEIAPKVLIL